MQLRELLTGAGMDGALPDRDVPIRNITPDSREVGPGDLFVALPGRSTDGHRFLADAVARGAAAVVVERPPDADPGVPVVLVPDAHVALGELACAYYDHPARHLRLIGVTGTDGKTTTATLIASILRAAGHRVGHLTTVELHDGVSARPNQAGFTTPPAMEVQRALSEMVRQGATHAVLEVSSHALATGRVAGCEFKIAVFTNLAREHLDYHETMDQYRREKLRLFQALDGSSGTFGDGVGVVNADDPSADHFLHHSPRAVTFSLQQPADYTADLVVYGPEETSFRLVSPQGEVPIRTRLLGQFNVYNWLAAAAAAVSAGATLADVARAAEQQPPVPGRLEVISRGEPFWVYVDFAHTPQGLAASLDALRAAHRGRIAAVFGHAGRRDSDHRSGLVEAARSRCDLFVLTMDDPYDEDPAAILEQMRQAALAAGCREGEDFLAVPDRRAAFEAAFAWARPGDVVLLAGRGHETTIPLNGASLPFHDATVARDLLATTEI